MRNRNSLIRERREAFRDARLIVIASEGKDTERIYFKALAKEYTNPRVHVHILERHENEQNNSSPEHVLKQLNDYKGQYDLESDDELWLVIDRDRWTDAMLSHVAKECAQDDYLHVALSNPCFELWLLLHLVDIIEYFFNFVEKRDLNNVFIQDKFKQPKYQAFQRYINRESHSLGQNINDFKDFDYNIFMDGLKMVFLEMGYSEHYKKMMKLK